MTYAVIVVRDLFFRESCEGCEGSLKVVFLIYVVGVVDFSLSLHD